MQKTLQVQTLKCVGYAKTISEKIAPIADVSAVAVDIEQILAHLSFEKEETIPFAEKSLADIGYPLAGDKNSVLTNAKFLVRCASGKLGQ